MVDILCSNCKNFKNSWCVLKNIPTGFFNKGCEKYETKI